MMKKLLWLAMAIFSLSSVACAPLRYDADLVGKVVDAKTGEPIPGTVIMGSWQKRHVTLAGGHSEDYDALAVVADENGEFHLPGKGLMLFTIVQPVGATVFKAGYDYLGIDRERLERYEGVVKLYKIDKERMKRRMPPMPEGEYKKKKAFYREIDNARVILGLTPSSHWNDTNE